jgi:hypothetical protein
LVLFNADHALAIDFTLPRVPSGESWSRAFDTFLPDEPTTNHAPGSVYPLPPCALVVFTAPASPPGKTAPRSPPSGKPRRPASSRDVATTAVR